MNASPATIADAAVDDTTTISESEARELTDRIRGTAENLWGLLAEAHSRGAWKALGYATWESYTSDEFGMSRGQAYRLLDQANVVAQLEAAASLEPGTLTESAPSARAAADLKPVMDDVAETVRERVKGRPASQRPAIVNEVVSEKRAEMAEARPARAAKPDKPAPTPKASAADLSLDGVLAALLKHPPVEARDLSNNRWAKVSSWFKQAGAVRNPIDAKATPVTKTSKGTKPVKAAAKKTASSSKDKSAACKHPVGRRIGNHCMECDQDV